MDGKIKSANNQITKDESEDFRAKYWENALNDPKNTENDCAGNQRKDGSVEKIICI